ncbi:MAG: hypothetical protein R2790_04880 [Flavobacterium haoranii]
MNLENLNVVELNAQEVQETEGGFWWFDWLVNVGSPSVPTYDYGYGVSVDLSA